MVWWQMNLVLTIQIHPKPTHPSFQAALPFSSNKDSTHCLWRSTGQFPPLTTTQPNFLITIQSPDESLKIPQVSNGIPNPQDNAKHQYVSKNFNWFPGFNWFQLVSYRFAGGQKVFFRRTCTCLNFCVWPSNGQSLKVLRINLKIEKMKSGRLTDFEIRVKCVRAYQTKSFRTVAAALAVLP